MAEGDSRQLSDETIHTYVRDGRLAAGAGNPRVAEEKFYTAFEVLLRSYQQSVIGFCRSMLWRPREEIEDLAQEIFLEAWRAIPGFEGRANIRTWLFTIVRNHCWDAMRKKGLQEVPLQENEEDASPALLDLNPLPQDVLEHWEFEARMRESVAKLEDIYREVLVMIYYAEFSTKEIAG
jgi:RNA polymerase sigma-70 factor, ECF subfamily